MMGSVESTEESVAGSTLLCPAAGVVSCASSVDAPPSTATRTVPAVENANNRNLTLILIDRSRIGHRRLTKLLKLRSYPDQQNMETQPSAAKIFLLIPPAYLFPFPAIIALTSPLNSVRVAASLYIACPPT